VNKSLKYFVSAYFFLNSLFTYSQVSELHLLDLSNCIPQKNTEAISSIEQSYKGGVLLYNEANNISLSDSQKIEKLISLFKIQVLTKIKLQEIWEQSDSILRENSSKYFTVAASAYKGLTDTISLSDPQFKSTKSAIIAVERMHQIVLLQKFGIQVLFGCLRESSGKLSQPTDISGIVINIDMVERFRNIWNESNFPMTYEMWAYTPTERKSFLAQDYSKIYKESHFDIKKEISKVDIANQDSIKQSSLGINNQNNIRNTDENLSQNKLNENRNAKTDFNKKGVNKNNQNYSIRGEYNPLEAIQNSQLEVKYLASQSKIRSLGIDYFSIQIAASKNQLVTENLKKEIYCGNLNIEERTENGWYKYLVGHFTSIDSANKFLASPCILRGFVSGYNSKGRVAILSIKQQKIPLMGDQKYSIVYRVQIAACKQALSNENLAKIYSGNNPINVSQENGWYRYSIGDFIYYNEAKESKDSCGVKEAFVMPYENGIRIQWPSKNSLELLKLQQSSNSIYVVQVAASKKPLPLHVINEVIRVNYPLTMKFEDGWYKYFISAFTDIATAKEIVEKIGIKGAFIATYKNGLRVNP